MIDPDVRPAGVADAEQLAFLEREARASIEDHRGGRRWLETNPERGERWADVVAESPVVVAHIGDVIVGYLAVDVVDEVATVVEVYVTPEARELGFGDAMLAAAIEHGRSAGCTVLEGSSLPGDRDTKNLYERAAITARLITVSTTI